MELRKRFFTLLISFLAIVITLSGCIQIVKQPSEPAEKPAPTAELPDIKSFTAQPNSITSGQEAKLSWQVNNADNITINPVVGVVSASGNAVVKPAETTTYTITAENSAGVKTAKVTVNVAQMAGKADLIVTDVFILANSVYFKAKNVGNEASQGCRAYVYVNNVKESDTYCDPLKPGEEREIVFNRWGWPYEIVSGMMSQHEAKKIVQYVTRVCVDAENSISEVNEANNCHTIIMGQKFVYDFVENAHLVIWSNGEKKLRFPTPADNSDGSIFTEKGMTLEDNRSHANILATYPRPVPGGYITGVFMDFFTGEGRVAISGTVEVLNARPIEIPVMCKFTAGAGFKKGAPPDAQARFVFAVVDDSGVAVYSQEIIAKNDGVIDSFDIDMNPFAGTKRNIVLRVESLGNPEKVYAVWVDPKLYQ